MFFCLFCANWRIWILSTDDWAHEESESCEMQKSEKVDGRGTDMGTRMLLKLKRVARKEKGSECNKCQIFFL